MDSVVCCDEWKNKLKSVLFTEKELNNRITELANQISKDLENKNVLCIGLMNGCLMFLANLLSKVTFKYKLDFLNVSSYGSKTVTSGKVDIKKDLDIDPSGYDVLVVEDIVDTGLTLNWVKKYLEGKNCNSIKMCSLLNKHESRLVNCDIDYVGFNCPNEFVVGYGLDYDNEFRCLPFIGAIDVTKL